MGCWYSGVGSRVVRPAGSLCQAWLGLPCVTHTWFQPVPVAPLQGSVGEASLRQGKKNTVWQCVRGVGERKAWETALQALRSMWQGGRRCSRLEQKFPGAQERPMEEQPLSLQPTGTSQSRSHCVVNTVVLLHGFVTLLVLFLLCKVWKSWLSHSTFHSWTKL